MNVANSRTEGKVYKGSGAVYSLRLEADGWMDGRKSFWARSRAARRKPYISSTDGVNIEGFEIQLSVRQR